MKVLVFTATYNEADNIEPLIKEISVALPNQDILVIDDNSPDGTSDILAKIKVNLPNLNFITRQGKLGLGSAHTTAMKYAIDKGYDAIITMDADFSHNPKYLPQIVSLLKDYDFVIGSRYLAEGHCDYGILRQVLSRTANWLVRFLLGSPLKESTTSLRGIRTSTLRALNPDTISSEGYSYFFEFVFWINKVTPNLTEFPIVFEDRRAGVSKISKKEIFKAVGTLVRLWLFGRFKQIKPLPKKVNE